MAGYAWRIIHDHTEEPDSPNAQTPSGPRDAPDYLRAIVDGSDLAGTGFKIYDDDGELYYSGRIAGEFEGHEPLTDFGAPNAGATLIRYPTRPELDSEA